MKLTLFEFKHIFFVQMSSRLTSIADADVLLHLPGRTKEQTFIEKGSKVTASILKNYFISKYLD